MNKGWKNRKGDWESGSSQSAPGNDSQKPHILAPVF